MIPANDLLLFAGAAFLMALTPGPNMIYLRDMGKLVHLLMDIDRLAKADPLRL